jgi:hypothetical protein
MVRRDSKVWRRSSNAPFEPPSASSRFVLSPFLLLFLIRSPLSSCRTFGLLRLRPSLVLTALASLALVLYVVLLAPPSSVPSPLNSALAHTRFAKWTDGEHPTFDFDHHDEAGGAPHEDDGEDSRLEEVEEVEESEDGTESVIDDDAMDDDGEEEEHAPSPPPEVTSLAKTSVPPFLPFSCQACSSANPSSSTSLFTSTVCSKYSPSPENPTSRSSSSLHPSVLDHSVLFPGTGEEIRRVLKRAMKSSLYGARRSREWREGDEKKLEDEEPFRILILGGSGAFFFPFLFSLYGLTSPLL